MRPFLLFRPGGGVPESVRAPLERAGSDVLVAGNAVFAQKDYAAAIAALRASAEAGAATA